MSSAERLARAALSRVGEPGEAVLGRYVAQVGAPEAWARIRAGDAALPDPLRRALAARVASCDPERDLRALARLDGRLVIPGDGDWPVPVEDLGYAESTAPFALWVRGRADLGELAGRAVAVVGARAASDYGGYVAAELAGGLAERGWGVVSGGAYGIDAAAHRGALAAGGATVVVLACGVDVCYPRGHDTLFAQVLARGGAVVSEWPPGALPYRVRFLTRNRLIAALSVGTVVVEAALRSGALTTARRAAALNRHVMAVPGPVTSAVSAGCHRLVRDGVATLVTHADDVVEQVGALGGDLAPLERQQELALPLDDLDAAHRRVLDALPLSGAVSAARVAVAAGVDAASALAALRELERRGAVQADERGYRARRR